MSVVKARVLGVDEPIRIEIHVYRFWYVDIPHRVNPISMHS
jgi:hypothetical protein